MCISYKANRAADMCVSRVGERALQSEGRRRFGNCCVCMAYGKGPSEEAGSAVHSMCVTAWFFPSWNDFPGSNMSVGYWVERFDHRSILLAMIRLLQCLSLLRLFGLGDSRQENYVLVLTQFLCLLFLFVWCLQTKGTTSFGERHNKTHTTCRRCGKVSYHIQKSTCSSCGYPAAKIRNHTNEKARGRRTIGTGRMRYMKTMTRRFKNGFREGTQAKKQK